MSSCFGPTKHPLVGRYYIELSEDGEPSIYFDDPQQGGINLAYAVATGRSKGYLIACGNDYYIFPLGAATLEDVRRAQLGPLTEAACKQKVFQLTGDSLHLSRFD